MPETTGEIMVSPPPPASLTPKPLDLREVKILQRLEKNFEGDSKVPEIRRTRAADLDKSIEKYTNKILSRITPDRIVEVQKKVDEVKKYFTTRDEELGMTPFERIAQIYEHLEIPTDPAERELFDKAIQEHMTLLGKRAFDQHYENPEQYVSHGFDHSIRVANYSNQIIENFPNVVSTIATEYGISVGQAKFIIENTALFHDCGYCGLAHGSNKVAHSVGSLRIVADEKLHGPMRTIFTTGDHKLGGKEFFKLMDDMEGAVLFHNADKIEKGYDAKMQNINGHWLGLVDATDVVDVLLHYEEWSKVDPRGDWYNPKEVVIRVKSEETRNRIEEDLKELFSKKGLDLSFMPTVYWDDPKVSTPLPQDLLYYGRKTDLTPGDKRIGLEYREADTLGYSLLALLRVGDNLDLLRDRFSQIQRLPAFSEMYRQMYGRDDLGDEQTKMSIVSNVLKAHPELSKEQIEKLQILGPLLDKESFKHFGGCEALRSVVFRQSQVDGSQAEIAIYVDKSLFLELQGYRFKEKTFGEGGKVEDIDMNIAEYQIWRLKEAVKVNLHGGNPIQIRVLDEEGNDLNQSTFLREKQ